MMKKSDLILIGSILVLALALFAVFALTREVGAYVTVRVDGEAVARYSLSEDGEHALNGGTNLLKIEDGEAWMVDAECPDHVCVKRGHVKLNGETITCLPNKLTVTVYGHDREVDLIVD